ncbi:MAG: hypothetical protein RIS47_1830 [Bacteroidota bacterium]|jgi:hypothetical protein
MKIAVDFDGTIVEHQYPEIGPEQLFAFETMRQLQKKGHNLILWTFRTGSRLDQAVEFCKERGVEFYAINASYPGEVLTTDTSRKLDVELFIDDRNFGGFPGWSEIWEAIGDRKSYNPEDPRQAMIKEIRKMSFRQRLKILF